MERVAKYSLIAEVKTLWCVCPISVFPVFGPFAATVRHRL